MYFNEKEDTKLLSFKDLNASLMRIMSCPEVLMVQKNWITKKRGEKQFKDDDEFKMQNIVSSGGI